MKVTANKKLDVGYVQFRNGRIKETVEIRPGILVDIDSKGEVIGIEVLSLRKLAPGFRATKRKTSKKVAA
jgi:uncharacterized protein YuzE